MTVATRRRRQPAHTFHKHDGTVPVLQGGGALGAYQAGALPPKLGSDPDLRRLAETCETGDVTIVHLINRRYSHSAYFKDYEFSRATIRDRASARGIQLRRVEKADGDPC